jgi:hypothetical protein
MHSKNAAMTNSLRARKPSVCLTGAASQIQGGGGGGSGCFGGAGLLRAQGGHITISDVCAQMICDVVHN